MHQETESDLKALDNVKKMLIRIGVFMAAFVLLCLIFTWLGFGRTVFVALLSGLLVAVLTVISIVAQRVLGPYESEHVKKFCYGTAPMGIVMLGVMSRMYPASFTPDVLAPSVSIAKLDENFDRYAGHKIRIEGKVSYVEGAGWGWDDEDIEVSNVDISIVDGESLVSVFCQFYEGEELPTVGSTVRLTGIVTLNVISGGQYLDAHRVRIIARADALASAD